jgi:mono/diheme cytochrome c family protein
VHRHARLTVLLAALLAVACGGEKAGAGAAGSDEARPAEAAGTRPGAAPSASESLPVKKPTGPIDEALAERGEKLFSSKGCVACHTIGQGKRVGPDLMGVTEKATFPWLFHWVSNPDSMLRSDTTARRLLREYLTPMPNQKVSPDEFRALYEYLREQGAREQKS